MQTHIDKNQKTQNSTITEVKNEQNKASIFQFVDKRPELAHMKKLQKLANHSSMNQSLAQLQQMTNEYAAKHEMPIQKKPNNTGLPDNLKTGIESLSGYAMDDVKVHYNSGKPAQLQAHAYAQGTNIHLAPGQEKHLPHEAWHVVQQKQGRVKPTHQLKEKMAVNANADLEKEADQVGTRAIQIAARTYTSVQRKSKNTQKEVVQRVVLSKISGHWSESEAVEHKDSMSMESSEDTEDNLYMIDDVIIGGRTPSPFAGTMGAHSTAWVAHLDAVRRQLVGASLGDGIKWLTTMAQHDLNSPLLKLDGYLNQIQRTNLGTARYHLTKHLEELNKYKDSNISKANYGRAITWLKSTINAYLSFVNFLPMSTVKGGDSKGHGEGAARNELNMFEFAVSVKHSEDQSGDTSAEGFDALKDSTVNGENSLLKNVDTTLKKLLRGNLQDEALTVYKKKIRGTLLSMFAQETPEVYAESHQNLKKSAVKQEVWALSLQNFLRTIRIAYPYAYDFAGLVKENVIKGMVTELNSSLNADEVYQYLAGTKKFTSISGTYTFHSGNLLQDTRNKTHIESKLSLEHKVDESEIRYTGTAVSDIEQGGSGFGANVLVDATTGKIGDVVMNGRTKSPFSGTMGAHTTAWTVHVDAVTRLLKGRSLTNAIRSLANRGRREMTQNKAIKYAGHLSEKHQIFLVQGYNSLKREIDRATGTIRSHNEGKMTNSLESLIFNYLNFVNLIPTSTIEVGKIPDGRSEGMHRTFLNNYEEEGDKVFNKNESKKEQTQIILDHLFGMLDAAGLKDFPPLLGHREPTDINEYVYGGYDKSHPLYEHISNKASTKDKKTVVFENFLHTIEEAYPRAAGVVHLHTRIKRVFPNVETSTDKRDKLLNKRARIIRNPADPTSSLYKGYQVEIKGVYNGKASVILLPTYNLQRVNVDLTSLVLE